MDYWFLILPYLLKGFEITLLVTVITLFLSIPLGIIGAVIHYYSRRWMKVFIDFYTSIMRGTPLLLQLFFVMYGLPMLGVVLDRMTVALLTFTLNYTAYFIEIFRGGILSIDQGQFEASYVLHLSKRKTLSEVILPQVFKRVLPTLTNETITLLKDTALVSTIAVADLLRNAKEIVARDLRIEAFIWTALIYLSFTYLIIFFFRLFEKKWSYYH